MKDSDSTIPQHSEAIFRPLDPIGANNRDHCQNTAILAENRISGDHALSSENGELQDSRYQESPTHTFPAGKDGALSHREHPSGDVRNGEPEVPDATCIMDANAKKVLSFILGTTAPWVLVGIVFMLVGIALIRFALLPRIYTCPYGATCPHSFDPRGQILRIIQTVMFYWLRIGCLIAAVGLFKVLSYQAWFIMQSKGTTLGTLELNLGTIQGSAFKAALLVWKRRNLSLGLLALSQIVIFTLVPLVVTRSISGLTAMGRVQATFAYPERFTLPGSWQGSVSMIKVWITTKAWLLGDNNTHPFDDLVGTFVFRDNRTTQALDAKPGGSRIFGTVTCSGNNISTVIIPPSADNPDVLYNVTYGDQWTTVSAHHFGSVFLGEQLIPTVSDDNTTVSLHLMWSSNTTGQLINSTATSDGQLHLAHCIHTIDLSPPENDLGDLLKPSSFFPPPEKQLGATAVCDGSHDQTCLKVYMGFVVLTSWTAYAERPTLPPRNIIGTYRYCQRGALAGVAGQPDQDCVVDSASWTRALAFFAEAVMEASEKNGIAFQDLWVLRQSISRSRWWLQSIIPASTLVLYVVSVAYVMYFARGRDVLGQLSVSEVIAAAVPEGSFQELVQRRKKVDELWVGGGPDARIDGDTTSRHGTSSIFAHPGDKGPKLEASAGSEVVQPNRRRLLLFLIGVTGHSVLAGVVFMFVGIIALRFGLLPRIYTCPDGAICRHSFDPHGPVLRTVQTVMQYWFQVGCFVSSLGLVKILAFQGGSSMMMKGDTVRKLELKLAAINGSVFKAALLMLRHSHRSLALFVLFYFAITSLIALIINLSISRTIGPVEVQFIYPEHFTLPGIVLPEIDTLATSFSDLTLQGYYQWLLATNQTHPLDRFSNTFVIRDQRTALALEAQPAGSRVTGTISCTTENISSTIIPPTPTAQVTSYNITYNNITAIAFSRVALGFSLLREPFVQIFDGDRKAVALHILWSGNVPGAIPNSTVTSDGKVHLTTCIHTIELVSIPVDHKEHLQPTTLSLTQEDRNGADPLCASSTQDEACMALIIARYLFRLWGGYRLGDLVQQGLPAILMMCLRGAWSTFGNSSDLGCRVDAQTWTVTLAALTDALLQTSQLSAENGTQYVWVGAETISRRRWWLQAVIPGAVLALWMMCIGYTVYLNPSMETLKKLTLSEIVATAALQRERVLEHIGRGEVIDLVTVGGVANRSSGGEEESIGQGKV